MDDMVFYWWENQLLVYLKFFLIYFFVLYFLLSGFFDYYSAYNQLHRSICAYLELNLWLLCFAAFPLMVGMRSQKVSNWKHFVLFFVFNDWIIIRCYIWVFLASEIGTGLNNSISSQVVLRHFESYFFLINCFQGLWWTWLLPRK